MRGEGEASTAQNAGTIVHDRRGRACRPGANGVATGPAGGRRFHERDPHMSEEILCRVGGPGAHTHTLLRE
jgi:hypothetical protein